MTMTLEDSYEKLHHCLYNILTTQFRKVGNTKLNATFTLPYNTVVKVSSEQTRDFKTDLQSIIFDKINQLETTVKNSQNFYEKNESFHKLNSYKEILNEVEKIL